MQSKAEMKLIRAALLDSIRQAGDVSTMEARARRNPFKKRWRGWDAICVLVLAFIAFM